MVSRRLVSIRGTLCRRVLVALILAVLCHSTARAELSLTPQREDYELEGMQLWRLVFETGTASNARYRPPDGWDYSGSAQRLNLRPPGKASAEASVVRLHLKDFPSCNESGAKKLDEIALGMLPEAAEGAKIESSAPGPLQISGKDTYLVQVSYNYYGQRFSRYCLFLVSESGPMRFQLTSLQTDYDQLVPAFQKSLHTWQRL